MLERVDEREEGQPFATSMDVRQCCSQHFNPTLFRCVDLLKSVASTFLYLLLTQRQSQKAYVSLSMRISHDKKDTRLVIHTHQSKYEYLGGMEGSSFMLNNSPSSYFYSLAWSHANRTTLGGGRHTDHQLLHLQHLFDADEHPYWTRPVPMRSAVLRSQLWQQEARRDCPVPPAVHRSGVRRRMRVSWGHSETQGGGTHLHGGGEYGSLTGPLRRESSSRLVSVLPGPVLRRACRDGGGRVFLLLLPCTALWLFSKP